MYRIVTVKELAEILRQHVMDERFLIDFTNDQDLEEEPTGWYGVEINNTFDGGNILLGCYGTGIDVCVSTSKTGRSYEDVIAEYLYAEFGGKRESYDENTLLCIEEGDE